MFSNKIWTLEDDLMITILAIEEKESIQDSANQDYVPKEYTPNEYL